MAIGGLKDFDDALVTNLPIVNENGDLIPENIKKRRDSWNTLMLAPDEPPRYLIRRIAFKNPYKAWNQLIARYEPTMTDAYTKISRQLETTVLEDPFDDPDRGSQSLCN